MKKKPITHAKTLSDLLFRFHLHNRETMPSNLPRIAGLQFKYSNTVKKCALRTKWAF
jgi:hypothetical protein